MFQKTARLRNILSALTIMLGAALCLAAVVLYVSGSAARSADMAKSVFTREGIGKAILWRLPLLLIWLAALAAALFTGVKARAAGPAAGKGPMEPLPGKERTPLIRTALMVLAAGLIVWGVLNGGLNDVFVKAVRICTECIGLG